MEYRNKIALGCGGFLLLALIVVVVSVALGSRHRTTDPEAARAISLAICPLVPPEPMVPVFAASAEVKTGPAAIWAVDSRFQNLMFVLRGAEAEPATADELIEQLMQVHFALAGFSAEPGAKREVIRILGAERTAVVQTARTVDESRQARVCVAFPHSGRWVLAMLQGDPVDATAAALEQLLARLAAPVDAG